MQLTPRDKRMLQVLAAVAGLALVYFVFTSVLGGGDDDVDIAAPTGITGATVPSTGPTSSPAPQATATLPPVVLAGARDPFSIPPELASAAAPTGAATTPPIGDGTSNIPPTGGPPTTSVPTTRPTSTPPTFSPSPTPPTGTPPTGTPPTGTPPTAPPGGDGDNGNGEPTNTITIGEHNLKLTSVAAKQHRVEILVDHRLWTVEEGGTFEEVYKLVKIQDKCARFLYGDDSFTLCLKT